MIKMVADAILEGSDRLVAGLKEINDTAKDMRKQELDLDMRILEENYSTSCRGTSRC
jgi:hypothetical protein